jgi:hypothetical protein
MMEDRLKKLEELCSRFRIDILYAFGSRAQDVREWFFGLRSSMSESVSDVDIGVKPARQVDFNIDQKVRMALALEDFLAVGRVDLVSLLDADPFLAANIIRGERLYARDDYLADEYDLYILRRAGDLAPLERERIALIMGEAV